MNLTYSAALVLVLASCAFSRAWAQGHGCERDIPDGFKRECHPESGVTEEKCRARDCVWCPREEGSITPWCFHPDTVPGFGCQEDFLPHEDRVDCSPDELATEENCRRKGCTWCPAEDGIPWCYHPGTTASTGYAMVGEPIAITNGLRVNLIKAGGAETLILDAEFHSDYRLRVKVYNDTRRFEVPLQIQPPSGGRNNPLYEIKFQNDPLFSFQVVRRSTGTVLFDSSPGKFIFSDQYLTLSWNPGSENVYGLGENEQPTFKHDFSKNITWGLWSRDQPPDYTANMYGVQPYYTVLETDGNAHSVAIINSNAQQFSMLSGPTIKYVTTGGLLDFYFFLGPTPENTVEQYTEAVGRPPMPPYWGLGFQLCRFGYDNIETMKATVDRMTQYEIPHDVQYGDIDIMHKALDFTYSRDRFAGLPEYIRELKQKGIKFVTILDPCISIGEDPEEYRPLKLGNEMDVWVKKEDGSPVLGKVWPEDPVYFPDYSKNSTREWWITLIREFHELLEYDGLWIDMNEPANQIEGDMGQECVKNNWNNPPFVPSIRGGKLSSATICPNHVQEAGRHYDVHSLYGWFESEPTLIGAQQGTGKRSLVLSRSTFLGSGRWAAHWLGDNWSRWSNLHFSIIGMLQYNHFGIPYVGADICGFLGDTTEEMCQRWMELGAFYPFSRNHNVVGAREQDPAIWPEVAESSKYALQIRYILLPYLYTLFYQSATKGGTVARALWHEFPRDSKTWGIDTQFMWGGGLLISPVLTEATTSVDAFFPDERFYTFGGGFEQSARGDYVNIPTPLNMINVHVRGGHVLPTQEPAVNTQLSRENPFGLIVALDDQAEASGQLFYDDGDAIGTIEAEKYYLAEYTVSNNTLTVDVVKNGYEGMASKLMNTIRLMGVWGRVTEVRIDGDNPHFNYFQLPSGEVDIIQLNIPMTNNFNISWTLN